MQVKHHFLNITLRSENSHYFKPKARPAIDISTILSTQISLSLRGPIISIEIILVSTHFYHPPSTLALKNLNIGSLEIIPQMVENVDEKEMRVDHRISPFLSSKSGSECFLPMSAMERTRGMRLLSFLSFWWWCFFSMASRTLSRRSSFSWPDATMLSISMSESYKHRSRDTNTVNIVKLKHSKAENTLLQRCHGTSYDARQVPPLAPIGNVVLQCVNIVVTWM